MYKLNKTAPTSSSGLHELCLQWEELTDVVRSTRATSTLFLVGMSWRSEAIALEPHCMLQVEDLTTDDGLQLWGKELRNARL